MNELSFGAPGWFWGLAILPVLAFLYLGAERRGARRLEQFVAAKLLPELAAAVNRTRRAVKFALLLLGLALTLVALAKPRVGYTYEDVKRRGLDLLLAVDTSRSMLSNDVPPNRLNRVKLSTQDLIKELEGDRVGLIAFAGRAFLQAPLTIDYDAAVEAINDIDTNTIPEGGTNISEAINLAVQTYGKSATGNRALIVFTDGEELSGDAAKTAKAAADAGVRIFTVGVGTPEGSLIPISGEGGGTAFVKDSKGQVVKSKLDEKRLTEIATVTGGNYLHLDDGPRTMRRLFTEGLSKMQAGEIDARISRRPVERFQWPLGAAMLSIAASFILRDRRRVRARANGKSRIALSTAAAAMLLVRGVSAASPGIDAYRGAKYPEAYQQFDETLKQHPQNPAEDKLHFDAGAAAYKMKDYGKALDSFSQALLSPEAGLQSRSHYNLGNTLYQRGETQKADEKKLSDWTNALQHYEQTLKLDPKNTEAKDNYEFVKRKIEELKQKKEQSPTPTPTPTPSPSPSPSPQSDKDKKQDKKDPQKKDDQSKQDPQPQKDKGDKEKEQPKDQSGEGDQPKPDEKQPKSGDKDQGGDKKKDDEHKPGESPSPAGSPSPGDKQNEQGGGASPSPSPGEKGDAKDQQKSPGGDQQPEPSPTPADGGAEAPSPSPSASGADGAGQENSPAPSPSSSPGKKPAGEVKGAGDEQAKESDQTAPVAEGEADKDGQMSEKQAELLLRSMKDEEKRVQLDERRAARHVYNDW